MALRITVTTDTTVPHRPVTDAEVYSLCLAGHLPAEMLPSGRRRALVVELHSLGWTDLEIAAHTSMSLYTTARLRDQLGLDAHAPAAEGAA